MLKDIKCKICGKELKQVHYLRKYCNKCKPFANKLRYLEKRKIELMRRHEYEHLSEREKLDALMDARKEIMGDLNGRAKVFKHIN